MLENYPNLKSFLDNIKRISPDIIITLLVLLGVFFIPEDATDPRLNFLASLGMVTIRITLGIMVAHITRKLMWPDISFMTEKDWSNNLMIIVWYMVIIWSFARGG
jgi:membrane-bound metal-dependent hydrolase YbcI (DUF457 family)